VLDEEDRSRDWYCYKCRERNFVKRLECFRCKAPKPSGVDCSVPPKPTIPQSGSTLNGMVKSYNRKGFGFLMVFGIDHFQDIHYTRENLSPKLQTRDIPGQHVTFEIHRSPDGKLVALNIRPMGEEFDFTDPGKGHGATREEEDQSLDWACASCGERNFVKRFECFRCKRVRTPGFSDPPSGDAPAQQRRTVSPHAGSRAWRELYAEEGSRGSDSSRSRGRRHRKRKKKRRKKNSKRNLSSSSKSSSSDRSRRSKRRKARSSSDASLSSSSKSSDCEMEEPRRATANSDGSAKAVTALRSHCGGNAEVERAKAQALEDLLRLQHLATKEARMTEFRALLRKWHPDVVEHGIWGYVT